MSYDVAVVGLGMGSAILAHCATRGARVIGFEQFGRGHDLGSSSGRSRMIRRAYFEDPAYVPLVRRAFHLWRELERETNTDILREVGVLAVGEEGSTIIKGIRRAAREHSLTIECLTRDETIARYPTLKLLADEVAILEPDAGVVVPERAIAAHLEVAERAGAELRFETAVQSWTRNGSGFDLLLANGERVAAGSLVLALGPWFQQTLATLGIPLRVQRNVQAWFAPARGEYGPEQFPAFLLDRRGLPAPLYGFPDFGDGLKAAFHGAGDLSAAAHVQREIVYERDVAPIARELDNFMSGAAQTFLAAKPCLYSLTPDENFVIDRHPEHKNVILCGGFSGHGFKFTPVIGEIAAALALGSETQHDIEFLSLRRFAGAKS